MAKEIEFTIDEDGNVEIDLIGFEGKGCTEMSDKLIKALGHATFQQKKKEFYKPVVKEKQKVRRG